MRVSVVGLRFDRFEPSAHALFSFSEQQLQDITLKIRKQTRSDACIVIATCDRIEVWCENTHADLAEPMLRAFSLPVLTWNKEIYHITSEDLLGHLFQLASGLLSPLFGEDQIISQLQHSLVRSRLCGCSSSLFEYLFRQAISAAKEVQTHVDLQVPDESVASFVFDKINQIHTEKVLIIGSSALSRLVATSLLNHGYAVTMTIRDLDKADFLLPEGITAIPYDVRYSVIPEYRVIISATKGMEYTVDQKLSSSDHVFIDLAPVKDIDPTLGLRDGIEIITLEDQKISFPKREQATVIAQEILDKRIEQTLQYLNYRKQVEPIQILAEQAANDLVYRLNSQLGANHLDDAFRETLYESARKAFSHQLYLEKKKSIDRTYVDLTKKLVSGGEVYPGDPQILLEPYCTFEDAGYRVTKLQFGSHSATHMDAPSHILESGRTLDTLTVSRFFATAYILDCSSFSAITVKELESLPESCDAVLFYTQGNSFLTEAAARYLLQMGIRIFGFDTPDCDEEGTLIIHNILLSSEALIIENLENLPMIFNKIVELICLPLLYTDADGAPVRVVAQVVNA